VGVTLGLFPATWVALQTISRCGAGRRDGVPTLLLYLIIIAAVGPSTLNVVLAITIGGFLAWLA
jgi:ABC-type dipeptide/oligopeptide/nickel transport system permease subunit